MAWVFLFLAGLFEVVWAFSMKRSEGFTVLVPTLITLIFMFASFQLLSQAMRTIPLGTAYPIWTGIGAVGSFAVGLLFLSESASPLRFAAVLLIAAGIALLAYDAA
ncbi:MAG: multidrug efflux SMR transporter [Paracoccus sp. (in: a-proteobacteria)]|nr:multidrug efflux SMR transporter [Paracoccus sp. (in: a-proteobacteria)]